METGRLFIAAAEQVEWATDSLLPKVTGRQEMPGPSLGPGSVTAFPVEAGRDPGWNPKGQPGRAGEWSCFPPGH